MKMRLFCLISLALATRKQFSLAHPVHRMPGGAAETKCRRLLLCLLTFLPTLLTPGSASADLYPVRPPGTYVDLTLDDFLVSNPFNSTPSLQLPIGNGYDQHPGWNYPFPPQQPLDYSIGVFSHPINERVILWETSGPGTGGGPGPTIAVGFWNGTTFFQRGSTVTVSYSDTGAISHSPSGSGMEINCDMISLSYFDIYDPFPDLNAVMIIVNPTGHNQVTAVATIPEPSSMGLLCAGIFGFLGCRWQSGKARGRTTSCACGLGGLEQREEEARCS
jgi:hypothetical protein